MTYIPLEENTDMKIYYLGPPEKFLPGHSGWLSHRGNRDDPRWCYCIFTPPENSSKALADIQDAGGEVTQTLIPVEWDKRRLGDDTSRSDGTAYRLDDLAIVGYEVSTRMVGSGQYWFCGRRVDDGKYLGCQIGTYTGSCANMAMEVLEQFARNENNRDATLTKTGDKWHLDKLRLLIVSRKVAIENGSGLAL